MKEIEEFTMLRKGDRVRLYSDQTKTYYRDGTVIMGAYASCIIYVNFDDTERIETVDGFKLVKIKN